ncbi:MAG: hypothetical protein JNL83_04935 [Myxococcales bacterium]|nr:hypothetical protein [Myxococcales bacterium]
MGFLFLFGDCDDRMYVFEVRFARTPSADERVQIVETFERSLSDAGARQSAKPWLWFETWAVIPVEYEDRSWFRDGIHGRFEAIAAVVPVEQVVHLNAQEDGDGLAASAHVAVGPKWDQWMWTDYSRGVFTRQAPRKGVPKIESLVDAAVEAARGALG